VSKSTDISLLVPGASGWEIWRRNADGQYECLEDEPVARPAEISKLPAGQLAMLFPVRGFHTLPFRAPSTDRDLFDDLAAMHAERHGIRPDPMGGRLSDTFEIAREEESTVLLHVVVRKPGEGDLPLRTPTEFDLSPRAFAIGGDVDTICVWKELGRWVFALHTAGKFLYAQATSSSAEAPDAGVVQEIRLAVSQLALQGLRFQPRSLRFWAPEGERADPGALAEGFDVRPTPEPRPNPVMPAPPSRILPEDVRAARRARSQRNQMVALVAVVALAVVGLAGWTGFGVWQDIRKRNRLRAEADKVEATKQIYELHRSKWDELGPVVESPRSPLEIMRVIQASIPANSGLRLTTADINLNSREVRLIGEAPQSAPINAFGLALKRRPELRWLEWETGAPNNTQKGWEFNFHGTPPGNQG
jgi:hypothetical protein